MSREIHFSRERSERAARRGQEGVPEPFDVQARERLSTAAMGYRAVSVALALPGSGTMARPRRGDSGGQKALAK
jgi:hypothetical protein